MLPVALKRPVFWGRDHDATSTRYRRRPACGIGRHAAGDSSRRSPARRQAAGEQPRLVAKLAKPLAPGKSIALKLNRPAGCNYYVLAKFGDEVESDSEGMDLCADKVIRLTE